jgi:hypothetical protein
MEGSSVTSYLYYLKKEIRICFEVKTNKSFMDMCGSNEII